MGPSTQHVIPCDKTGQEKENPEEETAIDATTLDQSDTSQEKAVEKQLEERLNIGAADCQSAQLDKIELKTETTSCNKEVEVNNSNSGVEVKVNWRRVVPPATVLGT